MWLPCSCTDRVRSDSVSGKSVCVVLRELRFSRLIVECERSLCVTVGLVVVAWVVSIVSLTGEPTGNSAVPGDSAT